MTTNFLDIPKPYKDDSEFTEAMLDSMMNSIETYASNNNFNLKQIILDVFSEGYTLDNDGVRNTSKSLQDQMIFPETLIHHEDFIETAAALASSGAGNFLTGSGTNGTQNIVASQNGILRLATTTTASSTSIVQWGAAHFDTLKAPKLEFRLRTSNITNTQIKAGWFVDSNDYIYFDFNTAVDASNIYVSTKDNGGSEVQTDTLSDLTASSYKKFRIELSALGTFKFFIDDIQVASSHTGTIQALSTFVPYFYVDNKAAAENKNMDIDYISITQNR